MLVALLPPTFQPTGTKALYYINRPNCVKMCNTVYILTYYCNGDRQENGSTVEIKVPIFESYKPKMRTISAAILAGKSPKIPALFQICFEIGRLYWVLVICARAIYTRRVARQYGICCLKKKLSMVHGTLHIFLE